jgi:hypothetical protein
MSRESVIREVANRFGHRFRQAGNGVAFGRLVDAIVDSAEDDEVNRSL